MPSSSNKVKVSRRLKATPSSDGADEMGAGVRGGDADESCAGIGVEMRGALAEEVGGPHEAVAAGGSVGGLGEQLLVGAGGREGVAEVAEAEARAVGDAHDVPAAGGGVAEGVEAAEAVFGGRVGCGEDDAAGADGRRDGAGREDAHADGSGALVACACGYGGASGQAGGSGAGGADAGADLGAFEEPGQPLHGDACGFGHLGGPAAVGDVEQKGSAGLLHVHGELAGEPVADIVLGAEDVGDAGEDFGLMVADPEEFGEGEVGQGGVAGELDQALEADLFGQPVALGLGSLIAPDQGWAEDLRRRRRA